MDIVSWTLVLKLTIAPGFESGYGATTPITGFESEVACTQAFSKVKHINAVDGLGKSFASSICIPSNLPVQKNVWTQLYMWSSLAGLRNGIGGPGSMTGYANEEQCQADSLMRFKDGKIDWSYCVKLHQ